ncbi:MAG: hypothetical protein IKK33_06875 [Lachnospiraceae bacterium]|nr:hypothetical protein [Lachnospiraceae bacterium]
MITGELRTRIKQAIREILEDFRATTKEEFMALEPDSGIYEDLKAGVLEEFDLNDDDIGELLDEVLEEEISIGKGYIEITDKRIEWVIQYFFEEGFSKVWKSFTSTGMKPVYRTILLDHLENLVQEQNYEWDLWSEGHLYAVKDGENYVFMYDRRNEKVILSMEEYWLILEKMLKIFTERYFCLSADKNKWMEMLEKARKKIWQE